MDDATVDRYLARIGVERPARADAGTLRRLQAAHLDAVPFENLSIHLEQAIALDEASVVDKLLEQRRGGFCYELNGGFAMLLRALGFEVELLGARVMGAAGLGPPLDHLALRVTTPEPWLVDVGFGAHSRHPLLLDTDDVQTDAAGSFQIVAAPHGDVDVMKDGRLQYRLELRPRELDEFAAMCWYQQHSPASMFSQSLVCTRPTETGRVTLSGRLLIRTVDGVRTETTIDDDHEILAAYREHFGVELTTVPAVRTAPPTG
jgi:N-hydroxyarylamine O-acetyltransferase